MLRIRFATIILLLSVLFSPSLLAQSITGTIYGTVHDQRGGMMTGVTVTARNTATGLQRQIASNDAGTFRIAALPVGLYELTAEKPGFKTAVIKNLTLAVDQVESIDLLMSVGEQTQQITVSSAVEVVNTETSKLGGIVDNRKVVDLPLNGRDFTQLARLQPGVAASGGGGGQQGGEGGVSGFSSDGARSSSNDFTVDGIDNNNFDAGSVSQLPSIDSIQEFEVQTNSYAAEFGRYSGSIVNLVTKSGTNNFHGSLFEFFRNNVLDARNFFDPATEPAPELRLNQFGGAFGGPIKKDHTFFFASYEGFRRVAGVTKITEVPTLAERQGMFTVNGQQIQVPVNIVSAQLFNLFPVPNLTGSSGNFVSSPLLTTDTDQGMIKIDHRFSSSDLFFARYSQSRNDTFYPFQPGQGGTDIPGYGVITPQKTALLALSYTKIFSPRLLNEARFGFNRSTSLTYNQSGPTASTYGFNTGWPPGSPLNLGNIPSIDFSGGLVSGASPISNLGAALANPYGAWNNIFQYLDQLSFTTNRHAFKFGADVRRIQLNRIFDLAFSGQIVFDGSQNPQGILNPVIDFAEGLPVESLQYIGDSHRGLRSTGWDFFAQDSFKIRSNLILNYGLRYELNTVLHDATGRLAAFIPQDFQTYFSPTASQSDIPALNNSGVFTQSQVGGIYKPNHLDFAPRVGLAYAFGGNKKTVIRTAYGIFYDSIIGNIIGNDILSPPFMPNFVQTPPFIHWPNSFAPSGFPVIAAPNRDFPNPYAQQWSFGVQQELPSSLLFQIGYVGTKGTHLSRYLEPDQAYNTQAELNTLTPSLTDRLTIIGVPAGAIPFLESHINLIPSIARSKYFGFAKIFEADNSVNSEYNALQTELDKRLGHGLSTLFAYTFARSIDEASTFFGTGANNTTIFPQNSFNAHAGERGLSDFDIRHRVSWSFTYAAPSLRNVLPALPAAMADGWNFTGILTLQTGQPFSIFTGTDNSANGDGNDRANVVGNPNGGPHTVQEWFNTAAFVPNALLTFGDSGRNIVTGPNFRNFDFAILKDTRIGERFIVEFRSEFFNLTNHPNFALPNNSMSSANFGALYQTPDVANNNVGLGSGGPRLIQFGVKLKF